MEIREKFISYILENIIPKAKYNPKKEIYEIKYEDYQQLNLSTKQKKILKEICKKLNIDIETIGYIRMPLTCIQDRKLFEEYNDIKNKLNSNLNKEEKDKLEQRRINIRNKIVSDNISFINDIINRRITNIDKREDKDDIYQLGYEVLIKYIDDNYLYEGIFKIRIDQTLIIRLTNMLLSQEETTDWRIKQELEAINKELENNESLSSKELSKKTNINKTRIEQLLVLKNILSATSLEEELESIDNNQDFYITSLEEDIIENIAKKEIISKIISTLSQKEQDILKLYYGFNSNSYNMQEIADIYNISKSRVSIIINNAINSIINSIRINYLNDLYSENKTYQYVHNKENQQLEEFLIKQLPTSLLKDILYNININNNPKLYSKTREIERKFANLYFINQNYKVSDVAEILNISKPHSFTIKNKIMLDIRKYIIETYIKCNEQEISYEEYLDYLMKVYLNNIKVKKKKKG